MNKLLSPLSVGDLHLANRIIMAPLTRCRASAGRVPNALMAEYYQARASAGLIIAEATAVTPMGVGYPDTPGIWTNAHIAGWRNVTDAVHEAGGKIILQLWHVGRVSHPDYLDGALPVSSSALAASGHVSLLRPVRNYVTPRPLALAEIPAVVDAFRQGAINAQQAGFDGVEIHAANGYLIDQFLQDSVNQRTDAYGGSIGNRARLLLEITDAVCAVWGAGRVGVHLAPRGDAHSMGDSNPLALFSFVAEALGKRRLAFMFLRESLAENRIGPALKKAFGGCVIANEAFTLESAQQVLANGEADAVSFGRAFIANPDLVRRLREGAALNTPDAKTFYGYGLDDPRQGYVDYPLLREVVEDLG